MGQYYYIANMEKKEVLQINGHFPGQKLMEIAETETESRAVLNQIAAGWKADHVYLVGDYATPGHAMHQYYQALQNWTDRFHVTESLYDYISENFQCVEGDTQDHGYRFIYNHTTREYIDMAHCPPCSEKVEWQNVRIAPLPLLIAMGNGQGGGDYYGKNSELVGAWCDSITTVEVKKEPDDSLGYQEFHPDFRYRT